MSTNMPEVDARRKIGNFPLSIKIPDGWNLIGIRPLDECENDDFLSILLCESKLRKPEHEYVTWLYNWQIQGCTCGHYFHGIEFALEDFCKRR